VARIVVDPDELRALASELRATSIELETAGVRLDHRPMPATPAYPDLDARQRRTALEMRGDTSAVCADEAAWLDLHADLAEIDWSSPLAPLLAAAAHLKFLGHAATDWKGANPTGGKSPFRSPALR